MTPTPTTQPPSQRRARYRTIIRQIITYGGGLCFLLFAPTLITNGTLKAMLFINAILVITIISGAILLALLYDLSTTIVGDSQ